MKRRVWALVTGAIRSDLYFRIILIKLCDMRAKGIIEEIVFSTWLGEIDKFDDLRNILKKLDIILVEKPYIDEANEGVFNELIYARQRETLANGLRIIPADVFVLRMRTDYIKGIRYLFKSIEELKNMDVKKYGDFPMIFSQKILIQIYNFTHLMFPNDRYFCGKKEDVNKLSLPVAYWKIRKFHLIADDNLLFGYVYHFYPLLRDIWDIIPREFYPLLRDYCIKQREETLVLPRLVHRIFATICVYIYTQVNIFGNRASNSGEYIELIDLYRDRIKTNEQIEFIVKGKLKDSSASAIFKDELRKIAINSSDVRSFTYAEYVELKLFVQQQLHKENLLGEYPYFVAENKNATIIEKDEAGEILLRKYDDDRHTKEIVSLVNEDFNDLGENVYLKLRPFSEADEILKNDLLKAGVFDDNRIAVYDYGEFLAKNISIFDPTTWNGAIRYVCRFTDLDPLTSNLIVACYHYLVAYKRMLSRAEVSKTRNQLIVAIKRILNRAGSVNLIQVDSEYEMLASLVQLLYKNAEEGGITERDIIIIEAILNIHPSSNPFSLKFVNQLHESGYAEFADRIKKDYSGAKFLAGNWLLSDKLTTLMKQNDIKSLIQYADSVEGRREAEWLARCMLSAMWDISQKEQDQVICAIDSLGTRLSLDIFPVKLARLIRSNRMNLNDEDMSLDSNFILLLETLYRRNGVKQNTNILQKYAYGQERLMQLYAFVRCDEDKRVRFFSMKNAKEIWLHYVPFLNHEKSKVFEVPAWGNENTWPGADRRNKSAFAAFISLWGNDVYVSIEFSAKDNAKARALAKVVGYDENNSPGYIIRLFTKKINIADENGLVRAVNEAMDEFCKVGEKVVKALDNV